MSPLGIKPKALLPRAGGGLNGPYPASRKTPEAPAFAGVHGTERAKLNVAAKQFEAIFIRQMLSAARQTDFGGGLFDSEALGTFRQMQDEKFADIAAQTGAFGIARQIEAQLASQLGGKA